MAISWCTSSGAHWHIHIYDPMHSYMGQCGISHPLSGDTTSMTPPPLPTHTSNLCVGVYMCICVWALRESVLTLSPPPSHTYTLIRPGSWNESFSIIYKHSFPQFDVLPPPTRAKNRSYTKCTRLFFEIIKVFIISDLCVGVCMCIRVCAVRESVLTFSPLAHIHTHSPGYVTWIMLIYSMHEQIFIFNLMSPPPRHVQKIDPTLRVLDYFLKS